MTVSIKKKLFISVAGMMIFLALVGAVGYMTISREVNTIQHVIEEDVTLLNMLNQLKIYLLQHRRSEKDYFLAIGNAETQAEYLSRFNETIPAVRSLAGRIMALAGTDAHLAHEIKQRSAAFADNYNIYLDGFGKVVQEVQKNPRLTPQQANRLMDTYKIAVPLLEKDLDEVIIAVKKMYEEVTAEAISQGRKGKVLIVVLSAISLVLAGLIFSLLSWSIYREVLRQRLLHL